jgi:ComF family protein
MSVLSTIRSLAADCIDLLYPSACAVCGKSADAPPLCDSCDVDLRRLEIAAACEKCAMPIAEHGAPCPHCLGKGLPPYGRVLRLAAYDQPLKIMLRDFKFRGRWDLGERLAERAYGQTAIADLLASADTIIPVPLHPLRQMTRGYNQAEILARRLAKLAQRPLIQPAVRLINTHAQTEVRSRSARLRNLRRAFAVTNPRAINGKHLIVVDDIRTTAATLRTFGQALRKAGAGKLDAIVMAATDPKRADFEII